MSPRRTIAVVDDHALFRKGLVALLSEFENIEVTIEASNGKELFEKLKEGVPDVIFLDLEMPVMNGFEATQLLRVRYPSARIIILTMHYEEELMHHMIEQGAHAFLSKNADVAVLHAALGSVISHGYYFDFDITRALAKGISRNRFDNRASDLSGKEIEVLRLICQQNTNREIADKLCLSPKTVDTYRGRIFAKTGVKNAVGLAFYALKCGLVDLKAI